MERLESVDQVIDRLGGTGRVAVLVGRSPQAVSNWRAQKRISPCLYLMMVSALADRRCGADPALWGMVAPKGAPQGAPKDAPRPEAA